MGTTYPPPTVICVFENSTKKGTSTSCGRRLRWRRVVVIRLRTSVNLKVLLRLQAGVDPNVSDFKGLTPLMTASMFGKTSTASFLLGMGASHHLTDINGDTALHWASYKGHAELIRLLLYSGADLTKADNFGSTPLHLAALSGNAESVKTLCQNVSEERAFSPFVSSKTFLLLTLLANPRSGVPRQDEGGSWCPALYFLDGIGQGSGTIAERVIRTSQKPIASNPVFGHGDTWTFLDSESSGFYVQYEWNERVEIL